MAAELKSSNPAFARGWPEPTAEDVRRIVEGDRLTIDDVVVHTLGLLAVVAGFGALGWYLAPDYPGIGLGAALAALVLSLVISFGRTIRPGLVLVFAALEGLFVGTISQIFESEYAGIVPTALLGTGLIFTGMLMAYRSGRLRATPRMRKVVLGALAGIVLVSLFDLGLRAAGGGRVPVLNDATPLGIALSVGILVIASLQFILDFDYVEKAIAAGAPRKEAWRAAFGLVVGFVWVYLELLRLLGKLRSD